MSCALCQRWRIIPADAGSTLPFHNWMPTTLGSSPRMRGAHFPYCRLYAHIGIIPADAGSTESVCYVRYRKRDHPRGCGEHPSLPLAQKPEGGSSPRMRGAPYHAGRVAELSRIIPADAGSTALDKASKKVRADHPRGCGEHCHDALPSTRTGGSSPRMRGALIASISISL